MTSTAALMYPTMAPKPEPSVFALTLATGARTEDFPAPRPVTVVSRTVVAQEPPPRPSRGELDAWWMNHQAGRAAAEARAKAAQAAASHRRKGAWR